MPSISTALDAARSSRGYLFTVVACSVLLTALAVMQWVRESRAAEPSAASGNGSPPESDLTPADLQRARMDAQERLQSAEAILAAAASQEEAAAAELEQLNGAAEQLEREVGGQEAEVVEARRLRDQIAGAAGPQEVDRGQPPENKRAEALKGVLADLQKQRLQLLTRFTPHHPVVQDVDRRIAEVSAMLQQVQPAETTPPAAPADDTLPEAEERLLAAEQKLDELRRELDGLNASRDKQMLLLANVQEESEYQQQEAERAAAELERLAALRPRLKKSPPAPEGPTSVGAFGLLFSLGLGCLLGCVAFIKAKPVSQLISSRAEVESILALPLIGLIPGTDDSHVPPPPPDLRMAKRIRLAAELTLATFAATTVAAVFVIEGHSDRLAAQPLSTIADGVRAIAEHVFA